MTTQLRPALVIFAMLTLLTGAAYPLLITAVGQTVFPSSANGSLIRDSKGNVVGSNWIAQPFDQDHYFRGRPSVTSPHPCNAAASSGANLGPTNPDLLKTLAERVDTAGKGAPRPVPVDLVAASASGLDPHISPSAAEYQVARVAAARNAPEGSIRALVDRHREGRTLGILGEPRVNVLLLNRALDAEFPMTKNK